MKAEFQTPDHLLYKTGFYFFGASRNRDRDWADIRSILVRLATQLDWEFITRELQPLCELKEQPEIVQRLLQLKNSINGE